jgi:hypothetical protein
MRFIILVVVLRGDHHDWSMISRRLANGVKLAVDGDGVSGMAGVQVRHHTGNTEPCLAGPTRVAALVMCGPAPGWFRAGGGWPDRLQ